MNKSSKGIKTGKMIQFLSHINFILYIYFITKKTTSKKSYIIITILIIFYLKIQKIFTKLYKSLKTNTKKNTLDKKNQNENYKGILEKKKKNQICKICKIQKITRSLHCNFCGFCNYLPLFHSNFLGACITEKQKILYLRYILFYFIFCVFSLFFIFYQFFQFFQNEILERGYNEIFFFNEGKKILIKVHSENWRFFVFFIIFFYLTSFLFFNFITAMKNCSFKLKNFEKELLKKKMEKFCDEIEYMNLYVNNYSIDRDDKNDLRENILFYSRWRINFYSLYNNQKYDNVFSLLKKIFYI